MRNWDTPEGYSGPIARSRHPNHECTYDYSEHSDLAHSLRDGDFKMVGHPKHVSRALAAGVDLICAQVGDAGGEKEANYN